MAFVKTAASKSHDTCKRKLTAKIVFTCSCVSMYSVFLLFKNALRPAAMPGKKSKGKTAPKDPDLGDSPGEGTYCFNMSTCVHIGRHRKT